MDKYNLEYLEDKVTEASWAIFQTRVLVLIVAMLEIYDFLF